MDIQKAVVLVLPIFIVLTACAGANRVDAVKQVKTYEAAHNAYDVEGSLAMFAPDAQFELVGQGTLATLESIRGIHEYDLAIHAQVTFRNCRAAGLTVTCESVERNDWLEAAGLGEIHYPSSVFTLTEAGQIQKIVATISPEDGAALGAVLVEFIPWLLEERPVESRQLFTSEGVFIYSEANGTLVVDLLRQWRGESQ